VDFGAAVVADEQSLEVVQPREGTFDDPAGATEPGAVRFATEVAKDGSLTVSWEGR